MNEWIVRGLFAAAGAATLKIVEIISSKMMEEREAKEPPAQIETTVEA